MRGALGHGTASGGRVLPPACPGAQQQEKGMNNLPQLKSWRECLSLGGGGGAAALHRQPSNLMRRAVSVSGTAATVLLALLAALSVREERGAHLRRVTLPPTPKRCPLSVTLPQAVSSLQGTRSLAMGSWFGDLVWLLVC